MWAIDWHDRWWCRVLRSARQCGLRAGGSSESTEVLAPPTRLARGVHGAGAGAGGGVVCGSRRSAAPSSPRRRPPYPPAGTRVVRRAGQHTERMHLSWLSLAPMKGLWAIGRAPEPLCSYCITAAGLLDMKSLVNGRNAAKGSRQTGCAPSEDAVAPEARPRGPAGSGVARSGASALTGRPPRTLCGADRPRPAPPLRQGPDARRDRPPWACAPRPAAPVATQWPMWNCCRAGESDCLIETQLRDGVPLAGPSR